jgi:hypothetical protein
MAARLWRRSALGRSHENTVCARTEVPRLCSLALIQEPERDELGSPFSLRSLPVLPSSTTRIDAVLNGLASLPASINRA